MCVLSPASGPASDSSAEFDNAKYLRDEVRAARAAITELDKHINDKCESFEEKSLELVEAAHRALSRLEQVRNMFGCAGYNQQVQLVLALRL